MNKALFGFVFTVSLLLLTGREVYAAPHLHAELTQDDIKPGDTTTLSITAEWPKEEAPYQFAFPSLPLQNLKVVRQGQSQEITPGPNGLIDRKIFSFELEPVKPGRAAVKAFNVSYVDPEQQKNGTLPVAAMDITVSKTRGMAGLIILGILTAVLGVPVLLGYYFHRGRFFHPDKTEPDSPIKAAADEFKRLLESSPALDENALPAVDKQLRVFLAEAYRIPAAHTTENELGSHLISAGIPKEELAMIQNILSGLEELKFVGKPTESEFRRLRSDLLRFIHSKQVSAI